MEHGCDLIVSEAKLLSRWPPSHPPGQWNKIGEITPLGKSSCSNCQEETRNPSINEGWHLITDTISTFPSYKWNHNAINKLHYV